jgi:hypothetical protein
LDVAQYAAGYLSAHAVQGLGEGVREHVKTCVQVFLAKYVRKWGRKKQPRIAPRGIAEVFDAVSWVTDDSLREMWVDLVGSTCGGSWGDEAVLPYIRALNAMTGAEARLLRCAAEHCGKVWGVGDFAVPAILMCDVETALLVAEVKTPHELDCHLDRMRMQGLGNFGMEVRAVSSHGVAVNLTPSSWGLALYVRCMGKRQIPAKYFRGELVRTEYVSWEAAAEANAAAIVGRKAGRRGKVKFVKVPYGEMIDATDPAAVAKAARRIGQKKT